MSDNRAAIDYRRTACLDDGWHAAVCVNPDGSTSLWLISPDPAAFGAPVCIDAPHERLGGLPVDYRRRINQCQAMTYKGRGRCSRAIPVGAELCPIHERMAQHRNVS